MTQSLAEFAIEHSSSDGWKHHLPSTVYVSPTEKFEIRKFTYVFQGSEPYRVKIDERGDAGPHGLFAKELINAFRDSLNTSELAYLMIEAAKKLSEHQNLNPKSNVCKVVKSRIEMVQYFGEDDA